MFRCVRAMGAMAVVCSAMMTADAPAGVETIVIAQSKVAAQPMKVFIGILGKASDTAEGRAWIAQLQHCCQWSGRFELTVQHLSEIPRKKSDIQKLFQHAYDCALFVTYNGARDPVEWRLYDTAMGQMLDGKKLANSAGFAPPANLLADVVLRQLTNEPQPFLSKIAYRKRDKRGLSHIIITDFDGSHAKDIVKSKRILVAPRWNNDPDCPILLFSEFTPNNVRLMMGDLTGRYTPVLDVDGTTVGVSYAQTSDDVVYCRSGEIWHYRYDKKYKKSKHTRVIRESDICASPILLANGDVIYCCRGVIKKYDAATGDRRVLIGDGYCVAPAYTPVGNKIAYAKRVKKQMEIFVYDPHTNKHEQVTFGSNDAKSKDYGANKTDPCWAPDGIHLAFCWERRGTSRIGLLNTLTHVHHFITAEQDYCSYPAWSVNLTIG